VQKSSEKKFGRILTWKLSFGSIDLLCKYDKTYEINMTGYQMVILTSFNSQSEITYAQLKLDSQIQPEKELKRHLLSLIKMKMLNK